MLSFFQRGVLDEILNLIESVSEGFFFLLLNNVLISSWNFSNFSSMPLCLHAASAAGVCDSVPLPVYVTQLETLSSLLTPF